MRRRVGFFIIAMAACGAASATAAVHNDYDSLFNAARENGRIVLIVYTMRTTCPIAIGARDFILSNRTNMRFLGRNFEVAEIPIRAGGQRYQEYRKRFKGTFIPFWVAATPDGEFLDGGDCNTIDSGSGSAWRRRVGSVASTHPPISNKAREETAGIWKQAQEEFEQGRYAQARAKATKIHKKVWYPKGVAEDAKKLLDKIAAAGQAALKEADALAKKEKHVQAAIAWDRMVESFSVGLPAGKAAAARLRTALAEHKEVKGPVEKARRQRQAARLLARAKKLEADNKPTAAKAAYQMLVRTYRNTPSAAEANKALERMGAVVAIPAPAPGAASRPSPAAAGDPGARLLQLARAYHSAGMTAKARAKLLELIQSHPDSASARQGRKLMTQWKMKPAG